MNNKKTYKSKKFIIFNIYNTLKSRIHFVIFSGYYYITPVILVFCGFF